MYPARVSAETVTYSYDSLGRLLSSAHTGGGNDGVVTSYVLDKAGNRTKHSVTGSPNGSATGVIVAPLGGSFVVIPFDRE
jgi:hypothetical protein